jgi:hypothetical protein
MSKFPLLMKDSHITTRVRALDRPFIRLIITQDRFIRFIHVRLTTTRALLTTLGTDTAADMEDTTDSRRYVPKMGAVQLPFFCINIDNIMTNTGNNCDLADLLVR